MADEQLPQVGDIFMTDFLVVLNGDHAEVRPAVVVRAPRHGLDYVTVVQRSTKAKPTQKGIDHPRDDTLGLNKAGRWVLDYTRAARCDQFIKGSEYRGQLGDEWLLPLIEAWEQQ